MNYVRSVHSKLGFVLIFCAMNLVTTGYVVGQTCDGCPDAGDNRFTRGDVNCDGDVDNADAWALYSYWGYGSPVPARLDAADVDDDGDVDADDVQHLFEHNFQGTFTPEKPFHYRGLDPTVDAFEGSCDLVKSRFDEFNCFTGAHDIDGDGFKDALYIVPDENEIRLESPGDPTEIVFFSNFQGADKPMSLAVGEQRVVYVLLSNAKAFYMLKDASGDGIADIVERHNLPTTISRPLDGVLADSEFGQSLVTLHTANLKEYLVLSFDTNGNGLVDQISQTILTDSLIWPVKSAAVDPSTGRVFVSGRSKADSSKTAVYFYEDTDGDKIVDTGNATAYVESPTSSNSFDGTAFVDETSDLLILSHPPSSAGGGAKVLCARDATDIYYQPTSEVVFVDNLDANAAMIHAYLKQNAGLRVTITFDDAWSVSEFEDDDLNCMVDGPEKIFAKPDAALAEAFEVGPIPPPGYFCRVQIYKDLAYKKQLCDPADPENPDPCAEPWDDCNIDGSQRLIRFLRVSDFYYCEEAEPCTCRKAGWDGAAPPVSARADWVPELPPGAANEAWIWVDGSTFWSYAKSGVCCRTDCTVSTRFQLESWVYFDGFDPACPPVTRPEFKISDVDRTLCAGGDNGNDNRNNQNCAGEHALPKEFKINARQRIVGERTFDLFIGCEEDQEWESASLKTKIRPKCSLVKPF